MCTCKKGKNECVSVRTSAKITAVMNSVINDVFEVMPSLRMAVS